MSEQEIDPYEVMIGGAKADPYRIGRAFGLGPAEGEALKKILRMGKKHKSRLQDAREVIKTMQRVIEMDLEDEESQKQNIAFLS